MKKIKLNRQKILKALKTVEGKKKPGDAQTSAFCLFMLESFEKIDKSTEFQNSSVKKSIKKSKKLLNLCCKLFIATSKIEKKSKKKQPKPSVKKNA